MAPDRPQDLHLPTGVTLSASLPEGSERILTPEALTFISALDRRFRTRRSELLEARQQVQEKLDSGWRPDFLSETAEIRKADWQVASPPSDLLDRRVEITGPVDRKMIINALNSGSQVFMADFEDSSSPTWNNCVEGQINLFDTVRRQVDFTHPDTGKQYRLNDETATLVVRPRGWHLDEVHVQVAGRPISASLFDFGLYFFHNAREAMARGTGPYFYLPKLESHLEARLWNDVFLSAQERLGIPSGTVRATVLIETLPAAFEMEEILYELREHSSGLNCGRWDYIFSFIKKLRADPSCVFPDRGLVGMNRHFLRSYSQLLIQTCHRRGAHAMGGMAAQIPIKDDPEVNARALEKVRTDKRREAQDGHDGTWVAHPGLVSIAREEFDAVLSGPHQLHKLREDVTVTASDLLEVPDGPITEQGLRQNLEVGVRYLAAWLSGAGCVPIHNLMEDAATAEISRTQVWQWIHHAASTEDGRKLTTQRVRDTLEEEMMRLESELGRKAFLSAKFPLAAEIFDRLIHKKSLEDFLTQVAYEHLCSAGTQKTTLENVTMTTPYLPDWTSISPQSANRWTGIRRDYSPREVESLRGSKQVEHTLARDGAERLWELLNTEEFIPALGALTGNQAMQMVRAGLKAIYLSGWQVAADANISGNMYPDQSLYPANSVPKVVQRINQCLQRADQIAHLEGDTSTEWFAPIIADAEAGFGGPLNAFELMKSMIEAGASGVHFEDQLASEKKCGHLGGKVLVPTTTFLRTLNAARLAADVCGVPTVLVARTDSNAAGLLTSDVDDRDRPFLTGERTPEGFFCVKPGIDQAISRGLSYAPYADLVWCETSTPDLAEAKSFAEAIHAEHPGKLLAYNCSPSFNWKAKLDDATIAKFQRELGAMGYKFQFVTLAGFHSLNHGMFSLASGYKDQGMEAYSKLQEAEFASEPDGYSATRHQHEVGTSYFDAVANAVSAGMSTTTAMQGSTESDQFEGRRAV